jgi:hypothetical protein
VVTNIQLMYGAGNDIAALSNLLSEAQGSDDDEPGSALAAYSPADLVNNAPKGANTTKKSEPEKDLKAIWEDYEVPREEEVEDPNETRKRPRYDILYKQDITTEDVFLGMSDKSPSSEDCTHMVVKVHFPGCVMKDLELDVTKERFLAESDTLRLSMYLPLPVDHNEGNAKWDSKKECLIVTLPILREEGF